MGGIAEAVCLQPIDVIKTRLQLDNKGRYSGVYNCGSTIARTEGVKSLWKGLTPFAANLTLKYALRFTTNSSACCVLRACCVRAVCVCVRARVSGLACALFKSRRKARGGGAKP